MKALILILALALAIPAMAEESTTGNDELAHLALSGWLAAGTSAVAINIAPENKWTRRAIVFGIAIAPGVYKETQMDERISQADMMANITGAIIGIWIGEKFGMWARGK